VNASAVSRKLRAAGYAPIPTHRRDREGIRVTNYSTPDAVVQVCVDFDNETRARNVADVLMLLIADFAKVERVAPNRILVLGGNT